VDFHFVSFAIALAALDARQVLMILDRRAADNTLPADSTLAGVRVISQPVK
jgi:hypothetical protein